MTLHEGLRRARALLEVGWCPPPFARDKAGRIVPMESEDAAQWPVLDALLVSMPVELVHDAESLVETFALRGTAHRTLTQWEIQRGRTQREVLDVVGRATARASLISKVRAA